MYLDKDWFNEILDENPSVLDVYLEILKLMELARSEQKYLD
ncbi:hypothetical protein MKY31_30745 [Bacillus sp. FSL M8-0139]